MTCFDLNLILQKYLDLMSRTSCYSKIYGPFTPFLQGLNLILSDHYHSMNDKNTYDLYRKCVSQWVQKLLEIYGDQVFESTFGYYLIHRIQNLANRDPRLTFRFIYQEIIYQRREKEDLGWDLIYAYCDDYLSKLNWVEHCDKEKEARCRALQKYQEIHLNETKEQGYKEEMIHGEQTENREQPELEEAMKSFRMFRQII